MNSIGVLGSTYTPEAFCNNANGLANGFTATVGGGGGPSSFVARPAWQSVYGIGLYSSSLAKRNQPDLSLFAGNGFWGHALPFCESDVYACDYATSPSDAFNLEAGGTSFVAPQIAGILALINQATGQAQGQADYTLYALAAQEYGAVATPNTANLNACSGSALGASVGSSCIFRDIAADTPSLQGGSIATGIVEPCKFSAVSHCYRTSNADTYGLSAITTSAHSSTLAYSAGAGYDLATGLGSVNIANLVHNWNSLPKGLASTTVLALSATPIAYSLSPTETLTATVTASGRGGTVAPGGLVQFFSGGSTSGPLLGSAAVVPNCTGSGATTICKGLATLALPRWPCPPPRR